MSLFLGFYCNAGPYMDFPVKSHLIGVDPVLTDHTKSLEPQNQANAGHSYASLGGLERVWDVGRI